MAERTEPVAESAAQWRELVRQVLARSGAADGQLADSELDELLGTRTYDGIALRPLYTDTDTDSASSLPGAPPYVRGAVAGRSGWDVRQRHVGTDVNAAVRADLAGGASSIWLAGIAPDAVAGALDGVSLAEVPIALDAGAECERAGHALLTLAERRGSDRSALRGTLGADPIGLRARTGAAADLDLLARLAERAADSPDLHLATVDATAYHDAGASDAQEIGIATAVGVAYLRALEAAGSVEQALSRLEFRFAVTADQFAGIAKLRAARQVWARVAELCGITAGRGQWQHAVTSTVMLTRRDPWVNLLRTTIGCFAGAVGGADAITVLPFDAALGMPDVTALRLARNTSAILHDESSLGRVQDAAGGSWYVETFTARLAASAWEVFTAIERAGGALAALDSGTIAGLIGVSRSQRDADLARRRAPLTGVSEFADLAEQPLSRPPDPDGRTGGPLSPHRYAEAFEALRDRADAAPSRPTVFLADLGSSPHSPRIAFARNLFAAGGIACTVGSGTSDELVSAFRESRTPVACLCATDAVYADSAVSEAAALKAAGATQLWLAGRAGELLNRFQSAGIDGYLYAGCDALAVLTATLDALEVS